MKPIKPGQKTVREWFRLLRETEQAGVDRDVEEFQRLGRVSGLYDIDEAAAYWEVGGDDDEPASESPDGRYRD